MTSVKMGECLKGVVKRFRSVSGFESRANDVLYAPPLQTAESPAVTVFFGGDIQDTKERMESHSSYRKYSNWCLENMTTSLQSRFVEDHIVVIRPCRMEHGTYSCYDNFVPSNSSGAPDHKPYYSALLHLKILLHSMFTLLHHQNGVCQAPTPLEADELSLKLVGFSKGCVVLNQLIFDFHHVMTTSGGESEKLFLRRIKEMYWLDGGHSKSSNTWITSEPVLKNLADLEVRIFVHVTPYQIEDSRRWWIKKEESEFTKALRKFGAPIQRTYHFEKDAPSIELHFEILNVFKVTS